MSTTTTTTTAFPALQTLHLRGEEATSTLRWWQTTEAAKNGEPYPYAKYLPTWDASTKYPPLEPFEHVDPGHQALRHAEPRAFLGHAQIEDLTPDFASEVSGIQLDKLDKTGREQLALYVAQRGVVAFRDQDFIDREPEWLINDWAKFFGRPHIHPVSGEPKGWPEFHLVHRDANPKFDFEDAPHLSTSVWHSDVTYEAQPPGLTALFLFDSPPSGGDTGYEDQRAAYKHLSPSLREYLESLKAVHSGIRQADEARKGGRGGIVKREPVENVHPIIRRHPVTGEKALFVNRQFTRHIVGLKREESDALLELLYSHIERGHDFQVRMRWKPRTVVLWDNRITTHSAIMDYGTTGLRRHGARITPQAERPTQQRLDQSGRVKGDGGS